MWKLAIRQQHIRSNPLQIYTFHFFMNFFREFFPTYCERSWSTEWSKNMFERSPWRCACPWCCERLQHQASGHRCASLHAPPTAARSYHQPLLPDESIRFPAAQGSTYEIDSIEKAQTAPPPPPSPIYNSPISPLRNFYDLRWRLTVSWKYVRHTFDMNLIVFEFLKNMWNFRFPVGMWHRICRSTRPWACQQQGLQITYDESSLAFLSFPLSTLFLCVH